MRLGAKYSGMQHLTEVIGRLKVADPHSELVKLRANFVQKINFEWGGTAGSDKRKWVGSVDCEVTLSTPSLSILLRYSTVTCAP